MGPTWRSDALVSCRAAADQPTLYPTWEEERQEGQRTEGEERTWGGECFLFFCILIQIKTDNIETHIYALTDTPPQPVCVCMSVCLPIFLGPTVLEFLALWGHMCKVGTWCSISSSQILKSVRSEQGSGLSQRKKKILVQEPENTSCKWVSS